MADDQRKDVSAHPMYYTETYHRAQVDKVLYGGVGAVTGTAIGGIAGHGFSKKAIKNIEEIVAELYRGGDALIISAHLAGDKKFLVQAPLVLGGAVAIGAVGKGLGEFLGYWKALASGPRPQQLNGWTGKVEQDRSVESPDRSIK